MNYQELIKGQLASQAQKTLPLPAAEMAFAGAPPGLRAFTPGALGNFPYYWQDPRTLAFNIKTYRWISAGLKAGAYPIQLAQPFANLYIDVLGKVGYSLSAADQKQLNRDRANILVKQSALLRAYKAAFGSLPQPSPGEQPIDAVLHTIQTTWAAPPTTLKKLLSTPDLSLVLNRMPAQGWSVLPALGDYLAAINQSIPLQNATVMNSGYLMAALDAVQDPTPANGALTASDGEILPAYAVATPLAQILAGLDSRDRSHRAQLNLAVTRVSENLLQVAPMVSGKRLETVEIPTKSFLNITPRRGHDLFKQVKAETPLEVSLIFDGATMVYFGPISFQKSTSQNWYWPQPILRALANGSSDISGFKFSPKPQVDFSKAGPFAFLTGVAISRQPSITLIDRSGQSLLKTFAAQDRTSLSFLDTPLGNGAGDRRYRIKTRSLPDRGAAVDLEPEDQGHSIDSTAYVLGVLPSYPAAS